MESLFGHATARHAGTETDSHDICHSMTFNKSNFKRRFSVNFALFNLVLLIWSMYGGNHQTRCVIRKRVYLIRWIELILCIVCLTLAIVVCPKQLHIVTKILLLTVSSAFLFITYIDVLSWCTIQPIGFKTWTMVSLAACLMFGLCGGFMILKRKTYGELMLATCIMNIITGLLYMIDYFWTMCEYNTRQLKRKICPRPTDAERVDKAVSACFLFEINEYECSAAKRKKNRYPIAVKPINTITTSYGGTFPVSKEQTPLPSPDGRRNSPTSSRKHASSSAPSRRRNDEYKICHHHHQHQYHGRNETVTDAMAYTCHDIELTDPNAVLRAQSFATRISEDYRPPFYIPSNLKGPKKYQILDTVPERDSKSSIDSKNYEFPVRERSPTNQK